MVDVLSPRRSRNCRMRKILSTSLLLFSLIISTPSSATDSMRRTLKPLPPLVVEGAKRHIHPKQIYRHHHAFVLSISPHRICQGLLQLLFLLLIAKIAATLPPTSAQDSLSAAPQRESFSSHEPPAGQSIAVVRPYQVRLAVVDPAPSPAACES